MDILDLGLLIFVIFYIFKNAYLSIVLFALISLILQQFSKNKLLFVLLPLLIAHLFFLYNNPQEGFRRRRRRRIWGKGIKKPLKKAKKYGNQFVQLQAENLSLKKKNKKEKKKTKAAEKETVVANKLTKIEKKQKKAIQRLTAQINNLANEHV
jgi:hypothetical protein